MASHSDVSSNLINHQNVNKETPMHKFTSTWPLKTEATMSTSDYTMRMWILRLFLKAGADPCLPDVTGSSCLDNLVIRGYEVEMNELAKEFGFQKAAVESVGTLSGKAKVMLAGLTIGAGNSSNLSPSTEEKRMQYLRMTSQSLLQSKKMLKKELELVASDEAKQIEQAGLIAVALFDFKGHSDSEITFLANEMMVIIDNASSEEWWLASLNGKKGWIPSRYVQIIRTAESLTNAIPSDEDGKKRNETVSLLKVVMKLLNSIDLVDNDVYFPILEEAKSNLNLAISSAMTLEQEASMYWKTKIALVIRAQSIVRGTIQRQRYSEMLRVKKLPKGPTDELLQTERIYISQLSVLIEKLVKPATGKGIFKSGDEVVVFLNTIEIIVETNKTLLKNMELYFNTPLGYRFSRSNPPFYYYASLPTASSPSQRHLTLGQIFLDLAPYLKVYSTYVEKYDPNEIRKVRAKNTAFDDLCKKFNVDINPYSVDDYFAKPMQRALKYSLLLKEIVKNLPDDHVEARSLSKAFDKMQELAMEWNERKRRVENLHEVLEIQKSISSLDLTIVAPSRTFVRKGEVTLYSKEKPELVQMILFNDLLLLATIKSKKSNKLVYLNACYLTATSLFDLPDLYDLVNAFQIVFRPQKKAKYRFFKSYTISSKDKKEWISDISTVTQKCKKSERRETMRAGGESIMEGTLSLRSYFVWRSRYVILKSNKLLFFASEKSKCMETIDLHSGFSIKIDNESKLAFTLEERTAGEMSAATLVGGLDKPISSYSFKANNIQEYRKWVSALRDVIAPLSFGAEHNE